MATLTSFEDLQCWKACREVVRWAARSTTRNIAEGFGRHHHGENTRFCRISRGSLTELQDDCITAFEQNYLTGEQYEEGRAKIETVLKLLNGYIRYLKTLAKN